MSNKKCVMSKDYFLKNGSLLFKHGDKVEVIEKENWIEIRKVGEFRWHTVPFLAVEPKEWVLNMYTEIKEDTNKSINTKGLKEQFFKEFADERSWKVFNPDNTPEDVWHFFAEKMKELCADAFLEGMGFAYEKDLSKLEIPQKQLQDLFNKYGI